MEHLQAKNTWLISHNVPTLPEPKWMKKVPKNGVRPSNDAVPQRSLAQVPTKPVVKASRPLPISSALSAEPYTVSSPATPNDFGIPDSQPIDRSDYDRTSIALSQNSSTQYQSYQEIEVPDSQPSQVFHLRHSHPLYRLSYLVECWLGSTVTLVVG